MHHPPKATYSGLTIILDKPGRHDTSGILIDGFAGQEFWKMLHPINRWTCDIRTADENNKPLLPNTKQVLLLGEGSLKLFKGDEVTLNEQRGCPFLVNNIPYLTTYAPQDAFDRRNYDQPEEDDESETDTVSEKAHQKTKRRNWKFWMAADCAKSIRLLQGANSASSSDNPTQTLFNYSYVFYPSSELIINTLKRAREKLLFIDIETDKRQTLTCIGISIVDKSAQPKSNVEVIVIPFKRYTGQIAYEPKATFEIFRWLAVAMGRNTVVAHNAIFDLFVLAYKYLIPFPKSIFCTMVAWHRLGFAEVEKSLGHLISYFTNLPYHKSEGVFDPQNHTQEEQLWSYNGKDIMGTVEIYFAIQNLIPKVKGGAESVEQAMRSLRPYLTMMYKGMRIDTAKFIDMFESYEKKSAQLERCLRIITKRNLNPRSPKQVEEYLYGSLGLDEPKEDKTNEKQLLKLLTKKVVPSIQLILSIRGERKLSSSLKFRLWNNNHDSNEYDRLTCAYIITGTDTFRLGSRKLLAFKPDPGFGTNCQNWDKKKRILVIPDKGKILGQNDQSGAEALIVAYLCRKGRFRQLFENGIKPHVFVALHIFDYVWRKKFDASVVDRALCTNIPNLKSIPGWKELENLIKDSDNWSSSERYYFIAKQCCHSLNYAIGWPTFQMNILLKSEGSVALPAAECRRLMDVYFNLFPEIKEWWLDIQNELRTNNRTLYNLFGFPRKFYGNWDDEMFKQAYAFKGQSTVGSITNIAITECQEDIESGRISPELGFDILQNNHDSAMWQCFDNKDCINICAARVKTALNKEFTSPKDGVKFSMKSECKIGYNWRDAHEKENTNGLKEIKI